MDAIALVTVTWMGPAIACMRAVPCCLDTQFRLYVLKSCECSELE